MSHYFFKLVPPRPTFPMDMTEAEGAIMQKHFAYWAELIARRGAVVYGPVMDPKGTFGVAILDAADDASAQAIATGDPAVKADAGFDFELHQMPDTIVRA